MTGPWKHLTLCCHFLLHPPSIKQLWGLEKDPLNPCDRTLVVIDAVGLSLLRTELDYLITLWTSGWEWSDWYDIESKQNLRYLKTAKKVLNNTFNNITTEVQRSREGIKETESLKYQENKSRNEQWLCEHKKCHNEPVKRSSQSRPTLHYRTEIFSFHSRRSLSVTHWRDFSL